MKLYKLIVHTKNFSVEDLIINPKDFPTLRKGDIVEIYHPEDEFSRLLLQITTFKEDLQGRETISVEQSIATTFQLRTYADVYMNVVSPDSVALDSVELIFKDQYLGRSEMWRLKNSLVNTCVYLNKKIEFCGGSVRCQVYEMWAMGDKVACGVITEDTKVVFRSSTAMVYLFIQMSSEMWDFDIHGDLYFEKAVNGFLAELFQKWKKHGSNHEVTIVLFSRLFYSAVTIEEFPLHMRRCLQLDYKGRFYEDFYRVVIQNERYDDWSHTLIQLRRLFTEYQRSVLEYHSRSSDCPKASVSTAAQGNFLEVLNISLNVFEKHFLERSFDRTGQLVVVITPGVGVFEVDRELTNVTKQRIIDNGVGCDLVCVGEQPLHAVPLLKFNNKDATTIADDYSMPHWINLSFFSSNKRVAYSTFIPRIKLPPRKTKSSSQSSGVRSRILFLDDDSFTPTTEEEYDAYDDQVFAPPSPHTSSLNRGNRLTKKASVSLLEGTPTAKMSKRKFSDPDIHHLEGTGSPPVTPVAVNIPPRSEDDSTIHTSSSALLTSSGDGKGRGNEGSLEGPVAGSVGSPGAGVPQLPSPSPARPGRSLINPFDPSHVTIKLTSNRRRWSHIFPKGPTGLLIQQHHYQAGPASNSNNSEQPCKALSSSPPPSEQRVARSASQVGLMDNILKPRSSVASVSGGQKKNQALIWGVTGEQEWSPALTTGPRPSVLSLPGSSTVGRKSMTLLWGATGEQEWTPALTTGVDWKSLTIPACLPITTDYFPDEVCLKTDYVFSDYNLLPDDVNADYAQQRAIYRKPLSTPEVFRELVSQRLAQGFQLIVEAGCSTGVGGGVAPGSAVVWPRAQEVEPFTEYKLSIGRVFHRIVLFGSEIRVTRYRPRHPYPPFNIHYHYRFQAPDHQTYEMSWVSFNTEKLETYNWNYLDHYICTRGDTDFALAESLKYWRFRVYILPVGSSGASRKILEGSECCDLYSPLSLEDQTHISETFLRFIETWINKIRRPAHKKSRLELANLNQASQLTRRRHSTGYMSFNSQTSVANSPFRERLGSNRLPDKPRPRSGSKVLERGRASPAIDSVPLTSGSVDSEHSDSVDDTLLVAGEVLVVKEPIVLVEVVDTMKHPLHGLSFVSPHTSLPGHVFVSADAVSWVKLHVENVTTYQQAVALLEDLRKEKLICHASGDFSRPFIVGFHLYHIVNYDPNKEEPKPLRDLQSFENEWLEVEVKPPQTPPAVPGFLSEDLPSQCHSDSQPGVLGGQYKHTHLEVDVQGKSDRVEWGHCRYQSVYRPDRAYELVIQWMAASGAVVCELISGWARKAQANQLLMIPIPPDPFALPYSIKSDVVRGDPSRGDPLRGPVFVPLDTESLMGTKSYLFEEFPEETWGQRLVLFQEAIAIKFGFIACSMENSSQHHHHQYIHLTGNVFLMIPSMSCESSSSRPSAASSSAPRSVRRYPTYNDVASSPHHEYISRTAHEDTKIGFLWSWNHMVSRRWKFMSSAPAKSDEAFQNKLFSDFRAFCSNSNNRLKTFWDSCWIIPG